MNLHVLPFGRDAKTAEITPPTQLPARPAGGSTPVDGGQFAKVYDASVVEAARVAKRGREPGEPIPSHVMDEVHAAARLYEELAARGRQIRFDMHKLDGRVVADGPRPQVLTDALLSQAYGAPLRYAEGEFPTLALAEAADA